MKIEIKKLLVLVFCIFLIQCSCAQKKTEFVKSTNIDVIKSNYRIGLELLSKEKFEESYLTICSRLEASKRINNKNLTGFGYQYLSDYYYQQKSYQLATVNLKFPLNIFINLKNEEEIYNCNYKLGSLYFNISEYDKSLEIYFTSLKIVKQNKNELQVADNLEKIGEVYLFQIYKLQELIFTKH